MEAVVVNIDDELKNYIALLNQSQKKSILDLIKSFVKKDKKEIKFQSVENDNQELKEPNEKYQIEESLSDESNSNEINGWIGKPQTIEEYNQELEEANARIESGEFYTHKEVKTMMNNLFK